MPGEHKASLVMVSSQDERLRKGREVGRCPGAGLDLGPWMRQCREEEPKASFNPQEVWTGPAQDNGYQDGGFPRRLPIKTPMYLCTGKQTNTASSREVEKMRALRVEPDVITLNIAISSCEKGACWEAGWDEHQSQAYVVLLLKTFTHAFGFCSLMLCSFARACSSWLHGRVGRSPGALFVSLEKPCVSLVCTQCHDISGVLPKPRTSSPSMQP